MSDFTATIKIDPALTRALQVLSTPARVFVPFLRLMGRRQQALARDRFMSGGPGHINSRTGTLRRSVVVDESQIASGFRVSVGSSLTYAGVHEYGATIRARRSARLVLRDRAGRAFASAVEVTIPARPFLAPALETAAGEAEGVLVDELRRQTGGVVS